MPPATPTGAHVTRARRLLESGLDANDVAQLLANADEAEVELRRLRNDETKCHQQLLRKVAEQETEIRELRCGVRDLAGAVGNLQEQLEVATTETKGA
jgi:hypothetical protein